MSYIYLCYHPDDHATMETIRDDLRKHNLIVEAQTHHTTDERDALYQAIVDAMCIVVLLSPSSQQSQLIRDAMHHANNEGIGVFLALVAGNVDDGFLEGISVEASIDIGDDYDKSIEQLNDKVVDYVGKLAKFTAEQSVTTDFSKDITNFDDFAPYIRNDLLVAMDKTQSRDDRIKAMYRLGNSAHNLPFFSVIRFGLYSDAPKQLIAWLWQQREKN